MQIQTSPFSVTASCRPRRRAVPVGWFPLISIGMHQLQVRVGAFSLNMCILKSSIVSLSTNTAQPLSHLKTQNLRQYLAVQATDSHANRKYFTCATHGTNIANLYLEEVYYCSCSWLDTLSWVMLPCSRTILTQANLLLEAAPPWDGLEGARAMQSF